MGMTGLGGKGSLRRWDDCPLKNCENLDQESHGRGNSIRVIRSKAQNQKSTKHVGEIEG